jgi:hypothetical protein
MRRFGDVLFVITTVRSSLFCGVTKRKMAVGYGCGGTSHLFLFKDQAVQGEFFKMQLLGCPETSVNNYQSTLRNIAEERRSR